MTEVIEKTEYKKGYKKTKLGWIPEDWEVKKLKSLVKINRNTLTENTKPEYQFYYLDISAVKQGKILIPHNTIIFSEAPCRARRIVKQNNILFSTVRPYLQSFAVMKNSKENFVASTGFAILSDFKNINNMYLYQSLYSNLLMNQYKKSLVGTNYPALNNTDMLNLKFICPNDIREQEKITEILSAWDDGIETLEKLIEQKEISHKALMKNLLIGKIRLFGFSKNSEYKRTKLGLIPVDWQVKPLKLLFDKRMQKYSGNTEYNIFTNSATKGVVLQNEYFDRSIVTEENTSNYYVVREDDFMYNPRISQSAPAGPINRNKLGITGIASPLYTIFKAKHDTIVDFYEQYFSSNLWNNSMFIVANQGARHDRLNITSNDFMNMPLPYPSTKEQEKIANILIESYKEIQLLNSKLDKLKEQKKGLMQKLLTGQIRVKV